MSVADTKKLLDALVNKGVFVVCSPSSSNDLTDEVAMQGLLTFLFCNYLIGVR